jgi:virulence factor Mce-like protein
MTRRGTASLVASPVLVGAVTVLISIIAVFIAYNANAGLPFVPTYDLKAELPSGAKLVAGNEVRVGGFRVGVVEEIGPAQAEGGRATAEIDMKLDKRVEPLARDTRIVVRPRSALGLKYVELTPGRSSRTLAPGDTIPLTAAGERLELEDIYSLFDDATRANAHAATEGFGDAFAGRGPSLNAAIEALSPLFRSLTPVMRSLSDPHTDLDNLLRQLGGAAAQVAPVAEVQAQLFTNMADTFAAIGADPAALQATIEKSPPTLDVAISSLRVQQPFLADFTDLSRRLRPAARELPRSLPALNAAIRIGEPVLARSVAFNKRLEGVNAELEELMDNPSTLLALRELHTAVSVARPAVEFLAPYQTVCNYTVTFINQLGRHFAAPVSGGTAERVLLKQAGNPAQPNQIGNTQSSRPADVPSNQDPQTAANAFGKLHALHGQPYSPAIDAQGRADCQNGQTGYLNRLVTDGRYPPDSDADGTFLGGGSHVVVDSDTPGLAGPTYKARDLGIDGLEDLP